MTYSIQELRLAELTRRVEALPAEVAAWTKRSRTDAALSVHLSQLDALEVFMDALLNKQRAQLQAVQSTSPSFADDAFRVIKDVIRVQKIWDFFRDKLSLRFSPDFQDALAIADTMAWNCHRPVLEAAAIHGIVDLVRTREPPLTYLIADFSPATWTRGSRPNDGSVYGLGAYSLPIPIIELPWDHLINTWELLSVAHEVGHDLEVDLKIREALRASLRAGLSAASLPAPRTDAWLGWCGEVFADLMAIQIAGPAFLDALVHLLLLPPAQVYAVDRADPHPNHYLRILFGAEYLRTLPQLPATPTTWDLAAKDRVAADADRIAAAWKALYPAPPAVLDAFRADFAHVWTALMDTGLAELQSKTVRELVPYGAAEDALIRAAATYLATGQNPPSKMAMKPRHCVSAARLALREVPLTTTLDSALEQINARAMQLVRNNTPDTPRGDVSAAHWKHIASFADAF